MADIEQELQAYAERRAGGRTARAARLVADAAQAYRAAVQAMQRHGPSSNKFWKALEATSYAVDAILYGLQGEPDYYFGARQFAEFLLPAMRAVGTCRVHPIAQQICFVGDFVVHTHCEALSLEQQLEGVRELCRHLHLADTERDVELQRQMRFCVLNAVAKIGFTSTARGDSRTPNDYHRRVHPRVELEAARCGALKGALRMLASPPSVAFLGGPSGGDCDSHVLYAAQRMAAAVGDQGDGATAAQLSEWLLQRPAVVRALHARLQRQAHEHYLNAALTCQLVAHLATLTPGLLRTFEGGGLLRDFKLRFEELIASPWRDLAGQVFLSERRLHRWQEDVEDAEAQQAQQAQQQQAQQAQKQQQPAAAREQLQGLPVRELKARCVAAGIDSSGCAEKGELVDLLLASQQRQDGGGGSGNGGRRGDGAEQQRQRGETNGAAAGPAQEQRPNKRCLCCGATSAPDGRKLKLCAGCRAVHFCSVDCQRAAWPGHKAACQAAQAATRDAAD